MLSGQCGVVKSQRSINSLRDRFVVMTAKSTDSPGNCRIFIDSDFEIHECSWENMSLQDLRTRTPAPEYGTTCSTWTYLHHVEFINEFSVVPGTDRVWRMQEYKLTASIVTVPSDILRFYHFGMSAPGISLSSRYCSKRISVSLVFELSVSVAG